MKNFPFSSTRSWCLLNDEFCEAGVLFSLHFPVRIGTSVECYSAIRKVPFLSSVGSFLFALAQRCSDPFCPPLRSSIFLWISQVSPDYLLINLDSFGAEPMVLGVNDWRREYCRPSGKPGVFVSLADLL